MDKAISIPIDESCIAISCGRDGTWIHFTASNGKSASINADLLYRGHTVGIIRSAIESWCEDMQKRADEIRADNSQFGVGS